MCVRMCALIYVVCAHACVYVCVVCACARVYRLCTTFVDPVIISPLMACRLIALDKNLGVRPIGIGETVSHIIANPYKNLLLVQAWS